MDQMHIRRIARLLFILVILLLVGSYFGARWVVNNRQRNIITSSEDTFTERKYVDLVTRQRIKPPDDPSYVLRSDNIRVGELTGDYIYLRFDRRIVGNESLENFRKYLDREATVISIALPEKAIEGKIPTVNESDKSVRDTLVVTFDRYQDGILTGTLETIAAKAGYFISEQSENCQTDDIRGTCIRYIDLNMKLTIRFSVKVL